MSNQPSSRQELYDRIRHSSKEEVILEEMIRLGFWPVKGEHPQDPAEEIRRRGEIQRELAALAAENRKLHNEKALRKKLYQERLAESKRKQKETKERRERERLERAKAWQERRQKDIVFLGEGVSAGLNETDCDPARLQQHGLPTYGTATEIAIAMGISIGELRFLAFSRRASTVSHYVRFKISKKTGGERLISAPMPRLKRAQYWLVENILNRIAIHPAAHGFCSGRSIVSNAQPHLQKSIVINLDLKDFFPTISYPRVKGLFRSLGYSNAAATIFALICTEPEIEEVKLDGRTYFVALTNRYLPQGAPTSPVITNILCRRLDRRLRSMAENLGYTYTRYADDLTFSVAKDNEKSIGKILSRAKAIVIHEGFQIHEQKTRVLRRSQHQEVTGVVVNQKLNVDRKSLKRFRATLHHIEQDGFEGKTWAGSKATLANIHGYANFVFMVNPEKGQAFLQQVRRIKQLHPPV